MFRLLTFLALALATVAAQAGQIQIGGTNGLTASYISSGCSGNAGCVAGSTNATAPSGASSSSPVAFTEGNYDNTLFNGATSGVAPKPYSTYSTASANTGTLTDTTNGITFNMINDGLTSSASNNVWMDGGTQDGNPTIEIPVGVIDVGSVWTMLNVDLANASPSRDAWIEFDFGATSTTATQAIILKLTNSANSSTPTGQLQNAVSCQVGCSGSNAGANGPTLASSNPTTVSVPTGYTASNISVVTNQLYSSAYTSGGYGTSGNVVLDDQGFVFNGALATLAASDYLVDVKVYESGSSGSSMVGLSAITVVTPEPATWSLAAAACGLFLVAAFLRKRRAGGALN